MRNTKGKKQKKLRRFVLFTLIVIFLLSASSSIINGFTNQYIDISEKHSKYYSGQGQTKSYGKDGFTTTFKTSDGKDRTFKSSGWYPTDEIIPYIAKVMYIK